jgi:hemerythrin superfamily protein
MPITEALARDHRELESLFSKLGAIPSRDPAQRKDVFLRLQSLLQAHSRAEEEVAYRALREKAPDEALLLQSYEEHHVADLLLQELASCLPGDAGWTAKAKVLQDTLERHIKEEELSVFALIDQHFDEATQAAMERNFEAIKHESLEALLAPLRRAMPAFAARAMLPVQVLAGRWVRRGELYLRGQTPVPEPTPRRRAASKRSRGSAGATAAAGRSAGTAESDSG